MAGTKKKTRKLRVLTVNTHMGGVLFVGGVNWIIKRIPGLHLVALQEVQTPKARQKARKIFPAKKWYEAVSSRDHDNVGTVCYAKKKRFRLRAVTQHAISPHESNMRPRRDLIALSLVDRQTNRRVDFSSIHTWHIVGLTLGDSGRIVQGHIKQVRTHAIFHGLAGQEDSQSVQLCAGDINERLGQPSRGPYSLSAEYILRKSGGLVPAYARTEKGSRWVDVDDIFFKKAPFIKLKRRRVFNIPFKVADHRAVYCVFEVEEA